MSSRYLLLALPCLLACACASSQNEASQALDRVGAETSDSYAKMRSMLDLGPKPKPPQKPAQPRYCYKAYEDIICYGQPLPGGETRLEAYQTASGKTGYVLPPNATPGIELPPLKSVDVGTPPAVKESKENGGKKLKEIIVNPADLAPQQLVPEKQQN